MENQALEAEVEAEIQCNQMLNESRASNESKIVNGGEDYKSIKSLDNIDIDSKSEESEISGNEIVSDFLNNLIDNVVNVVMERKQNEIPNYNHVENETQSVTSSLTR